MVNQANQSQVVASDGELYADVTFEANDVGLVLADIGIAFRTIERTIHQSNLFRKEEITSNVHVLFHISQKPGCLHVQNNRRVMFSAKDFRECDVYIYANSLQS